MIKCTCDLSALDVKNVETLKIKNTFFSYDDIAKIYVQDEKTFVSVLDGNVNISYGGTDIDELCEFLSFLSPRSVFGEFSVLTKLGLNAQRVAVFKRSNILKKPSNEGDRLKSEQIYSLLKRGGFSLPDYCFFATDFCHRLNGGGLKFFALDEICAAIGVIADKNMLVNGIVSLKKGMGSVALENLLSNGGCDTAFAVCREKLSPFYVKNGFSFSYYAGITEN